MPLTFCDPMPWKWKQVVGLVIVNGGTLNKRIQTKPHEAMMKSNSEFQVRREFGQSKQANVMG